MSAGHAASWAGRWPAGGGWASRGSGHGGPSRGGGHGWGPIGFGAFGGGSWGGGFGGRGRRRPRVRRGDVRAAVLALLAEGPRNGYQIIQEIGERSGGVWRPSPGSVYPALAQLEDEGLVQADQDSGRRAFRLTDEGRAYVEAHADEVAAPWAAVSDSIGDGLMELHHLIGEVAAAAVQVGHAGSQHQVDQARQALAHARRTIYRILADGDDEAERPAPEDGTRG